MKIYYLIIDLFKKRLDALLVGHEEAGAIDILQSGRVVLRSALKLQPLLQCHLVCISIREQLNGGELSLFARRNEHDGVALPAGDTRVWAPLRTITNHSVVRWLSHHQKTSRSVIYVVALHVKINLTPVHIRNYLLMSIKLIRSNILVLFMTVRISQ